MNGRPLVGIAEESLRVKDGRQAFIILTLKQAQEFQTTKNTRSLTNFVVKSKRKAKVTGGSVDFLFGLTIPKGPVGMPMADAYGKITKFVKEPKHKGGRSMQEMDNLNDNNSDDLYDEFIIRVDPKQTPVRIDKFLMDRLEKVSRNRVQNAIRTGSITVDGQDIKPNFKIKPGQEISVVVPRPPGEGMGVIPQNIPLDVVYEDEDVLIVNKKAGMVVHPGIGHHRGTLVNALAYHFGMDNLPVLNGNYNDRLGLVHRIDKNTSGLLVIAKTDYAMTHLAKQFYKHTVERTYYALIWGEPDEPKGTIVGNVGRHPRFRKEFTVFPEGEGGKWAVTHYEVMEGLYYVSLIKCNLETGRTHQIRVHMRHVGHPLFNDEKYGGDRIVKGTIFSKYKMFVENTFTIMPRHALHAKSLGFVHPRTGKEVYFESELPADFSEALDRWRRYVDGRRASLGGDLS